MSLLSQFNLIGFPISSIVVSPIVSLRFNKFLLPYQGPNFPFEANKNEDEIGLSGDDLRDIDALGLAHHHGAGQGPQEAGDGERDFEFGIDIDGKDLILPVDENEKSVVCVEFDDVHLAGVQSKSFVRYNQLQIRGVREKGVLSAENL
jgi:hypothetical protein